MEENCIFCKIVDGKIPSAKVFEDKEVLAFLDISPVNPGHCLVIPKQHYPTIIDIPPEELKTIIHEVKNIAEGVMKATEADGFHILMNNHEAAGQVVHHMHFHVIPRFKKDNVKLNWPAKKYKEGQMEEVRKRIAKQF